MKKQKFTNNRFLFPPLVVIILLTIASTIGLIAVFVNRQETAPVAYVIYLVSFYTLTVLCLAWWKTIPGHYRSMKKKVYQNAYANRYFTEPAFKTHVNLYASFGVNLLYVVVNAISGVVYRTAWFGIFSVYYAIIAVMRFLLIRYVNRNQIGKSRSGELKRSRLCAYILMTVNLVLSGVVLMMVYFQRGFQYQGFLIYVMALYTFYITTVAIVELVKYRKYQSPVMSVSKIIKLASALFSMLFLETAMFSQFGSGASEMFKRNMIMATGAGISVTVTVMAVYVIVRTTKEIKQLKREKQRSL